MNSGGLILDGLTAVWIRHLWLWQLLPMLVLDAFKGHLTEAVKRRVKQLITDLLIIPGSMTWWLQLLGVINKPLKDNLKGPYNCCVLHSIHSHRKGKKERNWSELQCEWVLKVWDNISRDSTVCGFKMWCISNNLDDREDDVCGELVYDPAAVILVRTSKRKRMKISEIQLIILN